MLLKRRKFAIKARKKTDKALKRLVEKETKTIMEDIEIAANNGKDYLHYDINKELTRVWLKSQGFTVKHCDSGVWTDTIQW